MIFRYKCPSLCSHDSSLSAFQCQLTPIRVHWPILQWRHHSNSKSSSLPCAITRQDYFWAMYFFDFICSLLRTFPASFYITSCILFLFKFQNYDETGGGKSKNETKILLPIRSHGLAHTLQITITNQSLIWRWPDKVDVSEVFYVRPEDIHKKHLLSLGKFGDYLGTEVLVRSWLGVAGI